jgi:hypothetical protein
LLAAFGLCACSIDCGANTASTPCVGGGDRGGTQTPTLDSVRRSPDHVDRSAASPDRDGQRFVAQSGGFGRMLGRDERWADRMVKSVGTGARQPHAGRKDALRLVERRGGQTVPTVDMGVRYRPPCRC